MTDAPDALCPVCYLPACDCIVCPECDAPVRLDPRSGGTLGLCWRGHRWTEGSRTLVHLLRANVIRRTELHGFTIYVELQRADDAGNVLRLDNARRDDDV